MKAQYPKMLYLNGDASQKYIVVEDAAAEQAANEDGYCRIGEEIVEVAVPVKPAKKQGRKGK
jgi:hypothetical protein